jgi:hypothetical protein
MVAEELRWFWHLAGELEFAQMPPERRALHRALSFSTAMLAKDLLREKKSVFRQKEPGPAFPELMTFLRRLRWSLLWVLAQHQLRDDAPSDRAEAAADLCAEAVLAYPGPPEDDDQAEALFDLIGRSASEASDDSADDPAWENRVGAGFERLLATDEIHDWLASTPGFEAARDQGADYGLLLDGAAMHANALVVRDPQICEGLSGFPEHDAALGRAMASGYGNFAVFCLFSFEDLDAKQIAGLRIGDMEVDDFGASLRITEKRSLFSASKEVSRRLTPFTRIAIEQTWNGRRSGPLVAFKDGTAPSETFLNIVHLQAGAPEQVSGDELKF